MVGDEHTIVGRVCKPPSRAQSLFTSSTSVYSDGLRLYERAQCEPHDNGPVVPIGNHRQDVPSVRFGGRDDAHLQDVDLRPDNGARQLPASREKTFQASFEVGMRTPGPSAAAPGAVAGSTNVGSRSSSLARSTRCRTLRGGDLAAEGDVFPSCACCSWLRFFRGGAQTTRRATAFCGWDNPTHLGRTL